MKVDYPLNSVDECFRYLHNNRWQFDLFNPYHKVSVNAEMFRSIYFHLGCANFNVPMLEDTEKLDDILKLRAAGCIP